MSNPIRFNIALASSSRLMTANTLLRPPHAHCSTSSLKIRLLKSAQLIRGDYSSGAEAHQNLKAYFDFYNNERLHQSLDDVTPKQVHSGAQRNANTATGITVQELGYK